MALANLTSEPSPELSEEERRKLREAFERHVAEIEQHFKQQFRKAMAEHPSTTIIYCQATYAGDYRDTLKCVKQVAPHVDHTIIVEDGSLTEKQKQKLETYPNVKVKTVPFLDNLPMYRNAYLEEAKKIDPYGWTLISDADELFCRELCREIRQITAELEKEGYNMAGINAHDQFEDVEWLDDLDVLRECLAGYRKTNFWKNLLFKLSPDTRYGSLGRLKTVHETWYSPTVSWHSINLHKRFFYTHRKSALKIWRNSARNMFLGGGGLESIGDLNPYWVKLKQICASLGIAAWTQFEDYMKAGNVDVQLKEWLIKALEAPATDWGIETRQTSKWYFTMHKEEITPEIMEKIKTLPPKPPLTEIEEWVTKCYFNVLERPPDEEGLNNYIKQISEGRIKREHLPIILFNSEEYKQKFLKQKFLDPRRNDIALCIMGYSEALPMILESVQVCKPHVDEIHVQGDNFTKDDVETLTKLGCEVHIEPWEDNFSDYKNKCINHATTKWVLILDHDEIPTPELAQNLQRLVQESEGGIKYNIVAFDSIDQTINAKGQVINENRGHSGKPLLHLNIKEPYYGNPHIWLKLNYYPWKGIRVECAYKHVKEEGIHLQRAVRNVFVGGGGDNLQEKNPLWPELRTLTNELGLQTYKQFLEYLKKGNVDPRLKQWMEKAHDFPWHDSELKAFKTHYYAIHPEEC